MAYDRYAVLIKPVGTGRNLTSTEARLLRDEGVSCSERWVVSPVGDERGLLGWLYKHDARVGCLVGQSIMVGPRD